MPSTRSDSIRRSFAFSPVQKFAKKLAPFAWIVLLLTLFFDHEAVKFRLFRQLGGRHDIVLDEPIFGSLEAMPSWNIRRIAASCHLGCRGGFMKSSNLEKN